MLLAASPTTPGAARRAATPVETQPRDGGGGGGGGGGGQREMFTVVCANCGADATVPFRPSGDRPVYCSDCFNRMRN